VERIWCTVLALNTLEEMDSSWLVDDEAVPERTVVDVGREFLEAQAAADRRVKKLLDSGALTAAAEKARKDWSAIQDYNVSQLRDTDVINRFTALTHIQRGSARVVRSMMTDHSTFATFLDTDGYIMRWQRFMILVTLVLSTLLVSIWCVRGRIVSLGAAHTPDHLFPRHRRFFYSKGATCCSEIRLILECDPVGPCRGFEGDCADIIPQFEGVQGPYIYGEPPEEHMFLDDYVCHAFPGVRAR
jgi:hypothetical protein